ncbi:MAG: hypothetical protein MUC68_04640 [Burkholderiaceae bacterium]|nr:hypothetical protein [Burkholderiaceae bacterium]
MNSTGVRAAAHVGKVTAIIAAMLATAGAQAAPAITHELQITGISHHFNAPQAAGRDWNQNHDGLGLQRTRVESGRALRYSAGFMRDSHGKQGLYAGLAYSLHGRRHGHALDLGIAPMLLWRTTRFDSVRLGPAPHRLVPALLPMFNYQHLPSGFGANVTAMPQVRLSEELQYPALVFVQFTKRLN